MIRTTFISLAMLALACAEGAAGSGATPDFQPTGGIVVASGNGARFNATRVQGPKVLFNQRSDGSWGGSVYGSAGTPTPIDATFQGGQFVGANIRLTITREGGQTSIFGSIRTASSASRWAPSRSASTPARGPAWGAPRPT
jgi:hypothetical protein